MRLRLSDHEPINELVGLGLEAAVLSRGGCPHSKFSPASAAPYATETNDRLSVIHRQGMAARSVRRSKIGLAN